MSSSTPTPETRQLILDTFAAHGVTLADLRCDHPYDDRDKFWCPTCDVSFGEAKSVSNHHARAHGPRLLVGICGEEALESILNELFRKHGCSTHAIASVIPGHTAHSTVRDILDDYGFEHADNRNGLAGKLLHMNAEEFDEVASRRSDPRIRNQRVFGGEEGGAD